ncbi:hypothetical protein AM571_CH03270 [Rhizobium etli 8C-3]|uniref:Uncharacterized protein n=1 Tax=Rhizobium etli 8C-3 TaxID=538025 RepID=A0A1L5P7C6_RHIET|nr:hypothetical protein AM571_CH03270 [Rhizobium etli 8C-3]
MKSSGVKAHHGLLVTRISDAMFSQIQLMSSSSPSKAAPAARALVEISQMLRETVLTMSAPGSRQSSPASLMRHRQWNGGRN